MRQSGTQACFSTHSSYVTVCHCEHMKTDAIITDSRNAACILPRFFTTVSEPEPLRSCPHSVFMCVSGSPCVFLMVCYITAFSMQSSLHPTLLIPCSPLSVNQCICDGKCGQLWEKTNSFVLYLTYKPPHLFYFFANILSLADPASLQEVLLRIPLK